MGHAIHRPGIGGELRRPIHDASEVQLDVEQRAVVAALADHHRQVLGLLQPDLGVARAQLHAGYKRPVAEMAGRGAHQAGAVAARLGAAPDAVSTLGGDAQVFGAIALGRAGQPFQRDRLLGLQALGCDAPGPAACAGGLVLDRLQADHLFAVESTGRHDDGQAVVGRVQAAACCADPGAGHHRAEHSTHGGDGGCGCRCGRWGRRRGW